MGKVSNISLHDTEELIQGNNCRVLNEPSKQIQCAENLEYSETSVYRSRE
jgi:hypothetical protein